MAHGYTVHRYAGQRFRLRPAALCTSARVACVWAAAIAVLLVLSSAKGLAAGKPAIVVAPSVQALSPSEVEFAVRVDDAESAPANTVSKASISIIGMMTMIADDPTFRTQFDEHVIAMRESCAGGKRAGFVTLHQARIADADGREPPLISVSVGSCRHGAICPRFSAAVP